jgi:flagellar assembly protein FliH
LSNVVKSELAGGYRQAAAFSLSDIEARAAAIVAKARAEGARIVAEARAQSARIRTDAAEVGRSEGIKAGRGEGRELGLAEGREEAYAEAHDEIANLTRALVTGCEELGRAKDTLFTQAQVDLVKLSLYIAKRIVAREIDSDKHVTAGNVERCLSLLSERKNLVVRVAPSLVDAVNERLPEMVRRLGDLSSVKVAADESIKPGGCELASQSGVIDATIDSQLDEIERVLFGDPNE